MILMHTLLTRTKSLVSEDVANELLYCKSDRLLGDALTHTHTDDTITVSDRSFPGLGYGLSYLYLCLGAFEKTLDFCGVAAA